MFKSVLRARPFDSEEECLDAVLKHKVQKGDAVFIRYEGPKGSGFLYSLSVCLIADLHISHIF